MNKNPLSDQSKHTPGNIETLPEEILEYLAAKNAGVATFAGFEEEFEEDGNDFSEEEHDQAIQEGALMAKPASPKIAPKKEGYCCKSILGKGTLTE